MRNRNTSSLVLLRNRKMSTKVSCHFSLGYPTLLLKSSDLTPWLVGSFNRHLCNANMNSDPYSVKQKCIITIYIPYNGPFDPQALMGKKIDDSPEHL